MQRVIWKCGLCEDVVVSYAIQRHQMDFCECGKSGMDVEEHYTRGIGDHIETISVKEQQVDGKWVRVKKPLTTDEKYNIIKPINMYKATGVNPVGSGGSIGAGMVQVPNRKMYKYVAEHPETKLVAIGEEDRSIVVARQSAIDKLYDKIQEFDNK